ncbi:hypothetical protein KSS87_010954 [Heliosperma pusillum]|nr:hypothetical protein KSS87_010954 [Heliosperma pusillum]
MVFTLSSPLFSPPLYNNGCSSLSLSNGINITSNISNYLVFRQKKIVCSCITPSRNLSDGVSSLKLSDSSVKMLNSTDEFEDDSDVLIECRNVYKSFGEKHILRGVSLKGEVYIRGKRRDGLISDDEALISGLRIGLVFQSAALFDSLSVRENVGFLLYENSRMPDDQISDLVTETLAAGVEERLPSELSGGMKKRVALARSLIFDTTKNTVEPEVLLYDEPTAGLDPIASTVVEDLIRSVHLKGEDAVGKTGQVASYVVVTHQHSTIRRSVDRLIFLYEGKIVWEGLTHEFTASTNPIVQQALTFSLKGLLDMISLLAKVNPSLNRLKSEQSKALAILEGRRWAFTHLLNSCTPPKVIATTTRKFLNSSLSSIKIIDVVNDFGARGDGTTDATQAFLNAWKAACASSVTTQINVPNGEYLLNFITFEGPCKSSIIFTIDGTFLAHGTSSDYWILFHNVDGLQIKGGVLDAKGQEVWECKASHQGCPEGATVK